MDEAHIAWHRNLFRALMEGAVWGVPRSGLMFRKKDGKMVLWERMPYLVEISADFAQGANVPASPSELAKYQQADFEKIAAHFRAAGVEVEDHTTNQTNQTITERNEQKCKSENS